MLPGRGTLSSSTQAQGSPAPANKGRPASTKQKMASPTSLETTLSHGPPLQLQTSDLAPHTYTLLNQTTPPGRLRRRAPPPPPSCTTCYCCYHRQHLQAATSYMTSIPFSDQPRRFLYGDGEDTRAHMADGWLLYCGGRNNLHGLAAAVANTGVRPTSDWLTALAWRRRSRTGHAAVSVIH